MSEWAPKALAERRNALIHRRTIDAGELGLVEAELQRRELAKAVGLS